MKNKFAKIKEGIPLLLTVIIVAKIVGMLRDSVLANYFGTSNISDAYLVASSVPTLLFYFIGHAISTSFIPIYNKVRYGDGEKNGIRYANFVINISLIISTALVLPLLIAPEIFVRLFAAGFDQETVKISAEFIRISAAGMYVMTLNSVFCGYLQANKSFLLPAAISLPRNAVIITSIVIAPYFGYVWLGIGIALSYVAELVLILPAVIKKGYRYLPILKIGKDYAKETGMLIAPVLLGLGVSQINKIIDRSIASSVCVGGVSALSYASIINSAVQEILVTGIITVLFSQCAEWVVRGEHAKVREKLGSTLNMLLFVLIPASVGVLLLAEPIVLLILGRGEFDANSLAMTSGALGFYTVGLVFLAARDTLIKVFYAYKETRLTTIVAVISVGINIGLNFALSKIMGLNGLALATSVSAVFNCVALYVLLRKKIGDFGFRKTLLIMIKSLLSAGVMTLGIIIIKKYIASSLSYGWELTVCVLAGIALYFGAAFILRTEPLIALLNFKIKNNNPER